MQDEAGMLCQERHTEKRYITAILHAAINLCSLTLLLFDSERKGLRHVYVYAKYGDVKKPKSRHASRAKIVQAYIAPSPSVFPPTHLIVGARNCVRNWPGFEAKLVLYTPWLLRTQVRAPTIKCVGG